jgi:hypothetical protein
MTRYDTPVRCDTNPSEDFMNGLSREYHLYIDGLKKAFENQVLHNYRRNEEYDNIVAELAHLWEYLDDAEQILVRNFSNTLYEEITDHGRIAIGA